MNNSAAKQFVANHARPVDLAVYRFFFEGSSREDVVSELAAFQNADGGFGHGLEMDFLNPHSSPIATNDALITLWRVGALRRGMPMLEGMVRYLDSHDSFDEERRRWLFAIDSNRDYPHAIWWEKEGDGIHGFNPTMSLAAFMLCFGRRAALYEQIVREGMAYLEENGDVSGEALKCFMLAEAMLRESGVEEVIPLEKLRALIASRLDTAICKDTEKYGVEYVPVPSDFFAGMFEQYVTPGLLERIAAEKRTLGQMQMEDGGFDITWEWGTPYCAEFEQARRWWRPRLTIDKLLFDAMDCGMKG